MSLSEHEPLDIVAEARTTAKLAEEERLAKELEQNDLRKVMGSKEGRRFMWRLLGRAGVFQTSFSTDSLMMAFNEGNRNAGLQQLSDILDTCPERYAEMMAEQKEAREKHDNRSNDRRNKHTR